MRKFLFVLTVTWLHISCESKALVSDPSQNGNTVADVDPVSEVTEVTTDVNASYSLSSSLASDSTSAVTVDCGNAKEIGFSSTTSQPTIWQTCVSGDISVDLSYGVNEFYVWFKESETNIVNAGKTAVTRFSGSIMGPTPSSTDNFADKSDTKLILSNGNIVVGNFKNSVVATEAGAVHLYSPYGEHISSVFGERTEDDMGNQVSVQFAGPAGNYSNSSPGIIGLSSGNFIVISFYYNSASLNKVGRVAAFNGLTGAELWKIEGQRANDVLGRYGGAIELSNGNILLNSSAENTASLTSAGTVRLLNPTTGAEIAKITGDASGDSIGGYGIHQLENGNIIILSATDKNGGLSGAGSVTLTDEGLNIITTIRGARAADYIGSFGYLELDDSRFAIMSPLENTASVTDVGSVAIYNGSTGALIGKATGDQANDYYGNGTVVKLSNGNIVFSNPDNDSASVTDIGSFVLMGQNGSVVSTLEGTYASDGEDQIIEALSNGSFAVGMPNANTASLSDAGKVKHINGSTGSVIATHEGDLASDKLSSGGISALDNGNFIISSPDDDVSGVVDAGSVKLVNGSTGAVISNLAGNNTSDKFGQAGVAPFSNSNYLMGAYFDDENGLTDNGSMHLLNGSTGAVIKSFYGSSNSAYMCGNCDSTYITEISNTTAYIPSYYETVDGMTAAGVVRFMNISTGEITKTIQGSKANQYLSVGESPLVHTEFNAVLIGDPKYGLTPSSTEGQIRIESIP